MKQTYCFSTFLIIFTVIFHLNSRAWSEHPMLVYPALKNLALWEQTKPVEAKSLKSFLVACENQLETALAAQEEWSRQHLPNYAPRPDALAFKATGNLDDIVLRFFTAIRINPNAKVPLYLQLLPGTEAGTRPFADPAELTTLKKLGSMKLNTYVWLTEGEMVNALDVLCTANDEPDFGFDLGLFEDNNTDYGKLYGFGNQSFGNPNLEYSSQAPFHMGFYHEAGILYKAGPFLKRTWIDYRIHLYKALSEFAFANNQPYWGWRFMGWGMHYVCDLAMPYHTRPLPGVSTMRMLWINVKAIIGFPKAKDNAVQLVSNRHTAFEEFQGQLIRRIHLASDWQHPFIKALTEINEIKPVDNRFVADVASKPAAYGSKATDKIIARNFPYRMVSDPAVEVSHLPEIDDVIPVIETEKGKASVDALTNGIAYHLKYFGLNARSYLASITSAART